MKSALKHGAGRPAAPAAGFHPPGSRDSSRVPGKLLRSSFGEKQY